MATNESSGRWDASGSFMDAVEEQRALARNWAENLPLVEVISGIEEMAVDPGIFTLYQRRALLEIVAWLMREGEVIGNWNITEAVGSAGTMLKLTPGASVHEGDILALQSGERVKVLALLVGGGVVVMRGFNSVVRPVALLDSVWRVGRDA